MSAKNTLHTLLDKTTWREEVDKTGWEKVTIGEILKLEYGKPLPQEDRCIKGGFPAFGANGVLCRSKKAYCNEPSIIVGRKGSAGEVNFANAPFYPTDVTFFVTHDKKKTDLKYLYYLLIKLNLKTLAIGVKPGINRNNVYALNTYLPPLPEQQKLATFLDEAFALIDDLIDNAQRHLELAKKLFSEILRETLSDQSGLTTFQLGEQVTFIDYRGKTPPKTTTGIRLITAKNVKMGFIQHTPEEFIEASIYDQWMTRGYPKNGDVLFTTEAPLGNVAQLYTDEKVVIGQRLITMKPNPEFLLPNFLKWLLMSDPVQRQIHSLATGATVQGIKARLLKTIQLAAPNIEKQKQLDAKLEQAWQITRELEQQYQEKLNTVKHLKTALLAKVFHETPLTAPPHSTPDKESIPKDHTPKESTA